MTISHAASTETRDAPKGMVWIPGGTFLMGSNDHYPEEAPVHPVTVDGFYIDQYQVTNAQFRRFAKETGYVTVAERVPNPEDYPGALPELLFAGSVVFTPPPAKVRLDDHYQWWAWVAGADWRHPEGPQSNLNGKERNPVLHLACEDVEAYAAWAGKSLPTEAEWEFAARGGLDGKEFAWGDELVPKGRYMANFWQGNFPTENLALDGFERSAPVGSFPPNGYGLYDMIGNAWEWTADWYSDRHLPAESCCGGDLNPLGGSRERSVDHAAGASAIPRKVLKGGSFACAENYCRRYRPAARMHHPVDTGTNHITFRCVVRPEK